MSKASELYPLPEEEKKELVKATLLSEGIIAVGGVIGAIILAFATTGDFIEALWLWLPQIASTLTLHWVAPVLCFLMIGVVFVIDSLGTKNSASYRKAKLELAQSLNGELPRLSNRDVIICMTLAGICEELLFRYVLIGLLMVLFGLILSPTLAAVLSVVVSAVIFWSVHAQYRDPWSISLALCGGLILGAGYVLSGSLLSCMIAHAIYNIAVLLIERSSMVKDPNYFGGKVPTTLLLDMAKK
ncbi:MAG: lysostaphin resistance A-like protein [Anaerotardibacter sp.]